jgi:hypothetical protein
MKTMTYAVLFVLALVFSAPPARAAQAQTPRCASDLRGGQVAPGCPEVLRVSRHRDDDHRHHHRHHDRHRDRHHDHHRDRHKHKDNDGNKAAAIAAGVALAAVVAAAAVSAKHHRDHDDDDDGDVPNFVMRNCNREARDWIESRRRGRYARLDRIQRVQYHDHRWRMNAYYRLVFDNHTRTRLASCVVDDRHRVRRFEFD